MPCPDQLDPGFGIAPPHRNAICFAKSYFGIGPDGLGIYRTGTGFLIDSGNVRRHVLTAAHNVFHHNVRREAQWISLWFGRNGATALATRDATGWSFPQAFEDADIAPGDCDYALLRINPLGADRFDGLTFAVSSAQGLTEKLLVGYPDEGTCKGKAEPWHVRLSVEPSSPKNYRYIDQPTYAGMSGGPLLTGNTAGDGYKAWGIHIRGGDTEQQRAIRFSESVYEEIMSWT